MASDAERDQLEACRDDLTAARRIHRRALENTMRLKLELLSALRHIGRSERALARGATDDVEAQLRKTRHMIGSAATAGWPKGVRIDGNVADSASVRPEFHRYCGMWRPPEPPASPQQLGCSAVVCYCLEELMNAAQLRQHWETGCFDWPEYETDVEAKELIKDLDLDGQVW